MFNGIPTLTAQKDLCVLIIRQPTSFYKVYVLYSYTVRFLWCIFCQRWRNKIAISEKKSINLNIYYRITIIRCKRKNRILLPDEEDIFAYAPQFLDWNLNSYKVFNNLGKIYFASSLLVQQQCQQRAASTHCLFQSSRLLCVFFMLFSVLFSLFDFFLKLGQKKASGSAPEIWKHLPLLSVEKLMCARSEGGSFIHLPELAHCVCLCFSLFERNFCGFCQRLLRQSTDQHLFHTVTSVEFQLS